EVWNQSQDQRPVLECPSLQGGPLGWVDSQRSRDGSNGRRTKFVAVASEVLRHAAVDSQAEIACGESSPRKSAVGGLRFVEHVGFCQTLQDPWRAAILRVGGDSPLLSLAQFLQVKATGAET